MLLQQGKFVVVCDWLAIQNVDTYIMSNVVAEDHI